MKCVLQYGQALSLAAKDLAGVPDSAVEPGVPTEVSAIVEVIDCAANSACIDGLTSFTSRHQADA